MLRIVPAVFLLGSLLFATGSSETGGDPRLQWKPTGDSNFEVSTQLRPWTVRDEGWDVIMENMGMAGVNNIYFLAIMHQEHRPFHAKEFPHNPVRDTFDAEDSTITWFPDEKRYGKIKPERSHHDWIREADWLQQTVEKCRKRGMAVGAEVSHYPISKGTLGKHPEWQQVDIDGNLQKMNFCPNDPDVRKYLLAVFGDIARYDLDYIQTCQYVWTPRSLTCICQDCRKASVGLMKGHLGIGGLEECIPKLREDAKASPWREYLNEFRFRTATKLFGEIAEAIRAENPKCHLRLNDVYSYRRKDPLKAGIKLKEICRHLGSLVNQDHQEQMGDPKEDFGARRDWLTANRGHLGADKPLICGIAPRMDAIPGKVVEGVKVAVTHPAKINGLALKHYDGASFGLMRAFRQGMIEGGVQGLEPILGREVEEMKLEGYSRFPKEIAEDWGVETKGTGRASCTFDLDSGTYEVRITYYDEANGRSPVRLLVAGKEAASFTMDEDCGCWRSRRFKDIEVNRGDEITLVGKADGGEQARLDFIEFIPQRKLR